MNNLVFCSTGAITGRANGWNWRVALEQGNSIQADGFEWMMEADYYDKWQTMAPVLASSPFSFPVFHIDKSIGVYLAGETGQEQRHGQALFEENCAFAKAIGAGRLVFHLWSGPVSDRFLSRNRKALPELYAMAGRYGLTLMLENVPCAVGNPLSHLEAIAQSYPMAQFVYDLRFGAFHEQNEAILASDLMKNGAITHVHVSDYVGPPHDFTSLRPIPHLGKGIIGLERLLPALAGVFSGTVTLESPSSTPEGCSVSDVNSDLAFLRYYLNEKRG